jgi:hypothetical protein
VGVGVAGVGVGVGGGGVGVGVGDAVVGVGVGVVGVGVGVGDAVVGFGVGVGDALATCTSWQDSASPGAVAAAALPAKAAAAPPEAAVSRALPAIKVTARRRPCAIRIPILVPSRRATAPDISAEPQQTRNAANNLTRERTWQGLPGRDFPGRQEPSPLAPAKCGTMATVLPRHRPAPGRVA